MSASDRAVRIAQTKAELDRVVALVVYVMQQGGIPEHEPAARAQLQAWLEEHLPTAGRLQDFYDVLAILDLMLPNLIAVVQAEARRRLEALNAQ